MTPKKNELTCYVFFDKDGKNGNVIVRQWRNVIVLYLYLQNT